MRTTIFFLSLLYLLLAIITCISLHFCVLQVTPLKGPVGGGTKITILGSNLGTSFSEVQNAVSVAGVPCKVDENEYEISARYGDADPVLWSLFTVLWSTLLLNMCSHKISCESKFQVPVKNTSKTIECLCVRETKYD